MPPKPPQPHFPSRYLRPSVFPRQARTVRTPDGARIAAFVYAPQHGDWREGTPILTLHGNGEEHGIFGPVIDAMVAEGRTVVAVDGRGQGKSSRGRDRLSYELLARDALAVLDFLSVDVAHVLGFSDGGIEALLLARDWPGRVASIVAMGANLTPEGVMAEPDWDIEGLVAQNRAWAKYLRRWSSQVHDRVLDHQGIHSSLLTPTAEEAAATADLLQLMLEEPHIDAASLTAISCPATIMVGEHDCIADYETCAIAQAIPGARLVVVPEAGHTLPKQAPGAVTRELRATVALAERDRGSG